MKKFLAIISLALVIATLVCLLSSCAAAKLKGTWESEDGERITFKSGGKGSWDDGDEPFTYKVKGKELKLTYTEGGYSDTETWTFSVQGKTLKLYIEGELYDTFKKVK